MSDSKSHAPKGDATQGATHQAGAFDIRTFIALLIGLYGVVLVVMGLVGTSEQELERAGGMNINLWAGLGMVVVAALFQVWAKARPVRVPEEPESTGTDRDETGQGKA
ncbi:MAG TPA: hypothetical protein VFY86_00025 [Nocardioides sp.]|jgi:hypothetical protein|nr:hypothetical protein [uncultured Nocardioides sp.]HEX5984881.1 hypothetical protein [Nocardioides sp.]